MKFDTALARCPAQHDGSGHVVGRQLDDVWMVADAAGSRARASLAASRAVEAAARFLARDPGVQGPSVRLRAAVEAANAAVFEEELPAPASLAHATSVVLAAISDERLVLVHAGNARCYRFRAGSRALLTRPHTAVAALDLDESTPFATHHRHLVTRALGLTRRVEPELSEHVLRPGDLLVLVNDALSAVVEERDVADLFIHRASVATVASTIKRLGEWHGIEGAVIAVEVAAPHGGTGEESEEGR